MKSNFKKTTIYPLFIGSLLASLSLSADPSSDVHKSRIHLQEVDSTQHFAKEHLDELSVNEPGRWVVITANKQKNPVGPQDRKWESSSDGNLYATFMTLFPRERLNDVAYTLQLSTFSIAQALEEYGIEARVTPTNDVIVGHKKISDCFCELVSSPSEEQSYLSVDVSLNVNMDVDQMALIPTSTSMFVETGKKFNKEQVLATISCYLKNAINQFLEQGVHSKLLDEVNDHLAYKGERVEVEIEPDSTISGKLIGLDTDGSFLLEMHRDEVWKISGGRILRVLSDEKMANMQPEEEEEDSVLDEELNS